MNGLINYTINVHGRLINLKEPQIMGILNVTSNSFYECSRMQTDIDIATRTNKIIAEGGTIIDVGAFSTHPGAQQVTQGEEIARLRRALKIIRKEQPAAVISVDTFRPQVAQMCVEEYGADIINDVSEGGITGIVNTPLQQTGDEYPEMFHMVARLQVPYILMSVKSEIKEMMISFAGEVQQLRDLGVKDIIVDPGYGFGKTMPQNYKLLDEIEKLKELELPILAGVSRKRMIYDILDGNADDSLNGTTVLNTISLIKGANILRVHDVKEAMEAVKICSQLYI